ncbi:MAG: hypothetical protein R6V30_01975 [Paracoccaceae bacterium]
MNAPRPFRTIFGLLAVAGVTKLALAFADYSQPPKTPTGAEHFPSLFFSAASAEGKAEDVEAENAAEALDTGEAAPMACSGLDGDTPEEVLAAIADERSLLEDQRSALEERAAEIDLANEMVAVKTGQLEELKQEVEALLDRAEATHLADVDRLVALYSNMKPRDAAVIMNDLDLEVMITVLGTMPERNAAPIVAALNPIRARAFSLILLERAKLPGDRRLDQVRLD